MRQARPDSETDRDPSIITGLRLRLPMKICPDSLGSAPSHVSCQAPRSGTAGSSNARPCGWRRREEGIGGTIADGGRCEGPLKAWPGSGFTASGESSGGFASYGQVCRRLPRRSRRRNSGSTAGAMSGRRSTPLTHLRDDASQVPRPDGRDDMRRILPVANGPPLWPGSASMPSRRPTCTANSGKRVRCGGTRSISPETPDFHHRHPTQRDRCNPDDSPAPATWRVWRTLPPSQGCQGESSGLHRSRWVG